MDQIGTRIKVEQPEPAHTTSIPGLDGSPTEDANEGLHPAKLLQANAVTESLPSRVKIDSFIPQSTVLQNANGLGRLHNNAKVHYEPETINADIPDANDSSEEPEAHESSDDSDTSYVDDENADKTYQEGSKRAATKGNKSRLPPAKTAREFFARLHEKEKQLRQEAKNNSKTHNGSRKARATKNPKANANSDLGVVAQLQQDLRNGESIRESVATTMPEMSTYTHAEQFALISNSIPDGSDNRRTKTQKRDLKLAVKSFGYKALKALDGNWLHRDMETALYNYQVTATSWMMGKELSKAGPAGGIIADEMGMGKTLMSLACVVGNPPGEIDLKKFLQTTLIIVPNQAVANQWRQEAITHLNHKISARVTIYSAKLYMSREILQDHWIVITTMHEIRQQYQARMNSADGVGDSQRYQLFELSWYRVILDEAHAIKNTNSKSKMACCFLKAKHRWALSGTPLSNNTTEFLPYLKFIGCDIDEDVASFKRGYMKEKKANEKLEALIAMVMYRRTKKDTFLGHKILDIPPCHTHDIHFTISQEEQIIYDFTKSVFHRIAKELEKATAIKMEAMDEGLIFGLEEKLEKELTRIYAEQYMHLRMVLSHSYNAESLYRTLPSGGEIETLRKALADLQGKKTVMDQLLQDPRLAAELERYGAGVNFVKRCPDPAIGGHVDFDVCLHLIQIEREAKAAKCASCHEQPKLPIKADSFISTAKVLGRMLEVAHIPFVYYYGCMSAAKKAQALEIFREEGFTAPRVMLISLKAGGQSLNLQCANRIIIIDPWWNVTAEQQAIGRAHRVGQKKECHVVRVLSNSDMDAKMLQLQRNKSEEVDYALQDDGHMPTLLDDDQREELFNFTTGKKKDKQGQTASKPACEGMERLRRLGAQPDNSNGNGGSSNKRRRC
ncbi:hypothetical protein EsDP_00006339 [Epichloe bromicola]|uniref:Uncharacterized protein n=1 Tax=Epichloe bromicola TaxID=79588 RepID=A0ABQ0CXC3_9HYPO